jgi:hypothetical protein
VVLLIAYVVGLGLREGALTAALFRATNTLHNRMFNSVLRAPMTFFCT